MEAQIRKEHNFSRLEIRRDSSVDERVISLNQARKEVSRQTLFFAQVLLRPEAVVLWVSQNSVGSYRGKTSTDTFSFLYSGHNRGAGYVNTEHMLF